jgi:hypothetical protein
MDKKQVAYARLLAGKIRTEEFAIFAGAGLSASAGFVDWATLLAPFAKELGLDSTKERDQLVRLAQYSQNEKGGHRHHLNESIIKAFPVMTKPGANHEILARMPIRTYWTTNYDKLLETSLRDVRKVVDAKWRDPQLPNAVPHRDAVVYKMHGDVESADEAVLTRDDYENYARDRPGFINALMGDLTVKTFLFIGFSFADPNLESILTQVRQRFQENQREHYCLIRAVQRTSYKKTADYTYDKAKQELFIRDLDRFNIRTILVNEYSEITELLAAMEKFYRRDCVFVSGSAENYGPWDKDEAEQFIRSLGALLVDMKLRLVSGLGTGVGNLIVSGAVEKAYASGIGNLDSFLEVRPFPQSVAAATDRDALWEKYRTEMLGKTGIAIFLFGNKLEAGNIVTATGVLDEFDLAVAGGVVPIPIGATGHAAGDLSSRVLREFDKYYPANDKTARRLLEALAKPRAKLRDYLPDIQLLLTHVTKDAL